MSCIKLSVTYINYINPRGRRILAILIECFGYENWASGCIWAFWPRPTPSILGSAMDTRGRPREKALYRTLSSSFHIHCIFGMAPSASKQKRLAEKAAKAASRGGDGTSTSTPTTSINGGSATNTPLSSLSAAPSREDLTSMAKLQIATDR
jgi:hypothetical protein